MANSRHQCTVTQCPGPKAYTRLGRGSYAELETKHNLDISISFPLIFV